MSDPIRRVAVSYSWSTEEQAEHTESVEAFCRRLRASGIEVLRDKDAVGFGGDLSAFMRQVGGSDRLCVFLSPAYLKSPNCMYELLTAWKVCAADPESFRDRVLVWTMPGVEIGNLAGRAEWIRHWRTEYEECQKLDAEFGDTLGPDSREQHRRIRDFVNEVDPILGFVGNTLIPRSFEDFAAWVEEQFPPPADGDDEEPDPEPSEAEIQAALDQTTRAMEEALAHSQALRDYLAHTAQGLLVESADGPCRLAPIVRQGDFDACPFLRPISERLDAYVGDSADLTDLEHFVGGLAVLALNSRWVVEQRRILQKPAPVEYPGRRANLDWDENQNAYFLHIVAAGLAGGVARLHRVFGPPPEVELPPPPVELRGLGEEDKAREVKRHLVKYLLDQDPGNLPDPELDLLFQRVRDAVRFALENQSFIDYSQPLGKDRKHDPKIAADPAYAQLAALIHGHLELPDLHIIVPSGRDLEDGIYTNPFDVMKYLYRIHNALRTKRQGGAT